jgi:hypothetical protein
MLYKRKNPLEARKWYRYYFFSKAEVMVLEDKTVIDASIANISFAGMGLYSSAPIGIGKKVKINIFYIDSNSQIQKDFIGGRVEWFSKLESIYLTGIFFDEELNIFAQPMLIKHLAWLTNTYNLPQPYQDKRISIL